MHRTGSIKAIDYLFTDTSAPRCFDWAMLDAIDDASLSTHSKPFVNFLKNFINAKTFSNGTTKQLRHLILILQKSLVYFTTGHRRMNEKLAEANRTIMSMQHEMEHMKRLGAQSFVCPICLTTFESIDTLDMHFGSAHPSHLPYWTELQKARPQQTRVFDTEIRPGTKTITQNDVMDTVGGLLQQRAQTTSATLKDMQKWVNEKFDEFERIIRAQESVSYTSSSDYTEPTQPKKRRVKRKPRKPAEPKRETSHSSKHTAQPEPGEVQILHSSTVSSHHSTATSSYETSSEKQPVLPSPQEERPPSRTKSRQSYESSTSFLDIPKPPSFRSKRKS